MSDFFAKIDTSWQDTDPFELSAYVLWRINWIHPFLEGNGRTARAAAYYVLSRKLELLIPGKVTIVGQLSGSKDYYSGLRHADVNVSDSGDHDLLPLADLLRECLNIQLRSAGIEF